MEPFDYLKIFDTAGYEAYIVGGYVRDYILGIQSFDVDITTSATPQEMSKLLNIECDDTYGSINIQDGNYNIDITTFRSEGNYRDRCPQEILYIKDLYSDLKRRDFTINTICLDSKGNLLDPLKGIDDLKNGILRVVGDIESKFVDDPLRMLRALRISITHDLKIEDSALNIILNNKYLLESITYSRRRICLTKILMSDNVLRGLLVLKQYGLLEVLGISFKESYVPSKNILASWAQLRFDDKYPFSKKELKTIANIREILSNGIIDQFTLFKYGIDDVISAGEILGIDEDKIIDMEHPMVIKKSSDLSINGYDIMSIIGESNKTKIKEVKEDLIKLILSGNLTNSKKDLSNYIKKKWK